MNGAVSKPGVIAVASGLLASTWVDVAWACPSCATRDEGGIGMSIAIGAFLVVPFAIAIGIARFIKNGDHEV